MRCHQLVDAFSPLASVGSVVLVIVTSCGLSYAVDDMFPVHPKAETILIEFREQGRLYGSRWDALLAKTTKICHPMDANSLAHTALSFVNLQREVGMAPLIECDPKVILSLCPAMDKLNDRGLKELVKIFVQLQAICSAVAYPKRNKAAKKVIELASKINGAVLEELSSLESAMLQRAALVEAENPEAVLRGNATGNGNLSTPSLPSSTGLPDMLSLVSSLADDASQAIKELMNKGSYYLCIAYILVTYVSLLLATHWLTCGLLRSARQSCFIVAFSNCVVHSWILHKSHAYAPNTINMAWLTPNLTDSTLVHCGFLVLLLLLASVQRENVRLKCLRHIGAQHVQIRNIIQEIHQARRAAP